MTRVLTPTLTQATILTAMVDRAKFDKICSRPIHRTMKSWAEPETNPQFTLFKLHKSSQLTCVSIATNYWMGHIGMCNTKAVGIGFRSHANTMTNLTLCSFNRITATAVCIRPVNVCRFCKRTLVGVKTHEIGMTAKSLVERCTSWRRQPRACVQKPGINPRGIMCLLDDGVFGVQAPRSEPLQEAVARVRYLPRG